MRHLAPQPVVAADYDSLSSSPPPAMHATRRPPLLLALLVIHVSLVLSSDKRHFDSLVSQQRLMRSREDKIRARDALLLRQEDEGTGKRSRSSDSTARAAKFHSTELTLANTHFLRIRTEFSCQRPRPRLVYMKDLFLSPEKMFMPRFVLCSGAHAD